MGAQQARTLADASQAVAQHAGTRDGRQWDVEQAKALALASIAQSLAVIAGGIEADIGPQS